jgi:hypothetical protein
MTRQTVAMLSSQPTEWIADSNDVASG